MRVYLDKEKLKEVKFNTNWQETFNSLGLKKDNRKSKKFDWWCKSPFTNEKTPSFHVNARGFKCFSSGKSGDIIELVKEVLKLTDSFSAARWLLKNGLSHIAGLSSSVKNPSYEKNNLTFNSRKQVKNREKKKKESLENPPVTKSLIPYLISDHREFLARGLTSSTCSYLGCGYLPPQKTQKNSKMRGKVVFQVRGVRRNEAGDLKPVILTHLARTLDAAELELGEKWRAYKGFLKKIELYNIDRILLDPVAIKQAKETGHIIIVEGCFDVAKLVEANIKNVVSCFGSFIFKEQIKRFQLISETLGINKFLIFFDRDEAGKNGSEKGKTLFEKSGFNVSVFDWNKKFVTEEKQNIPIPQNINDPCQLKSQGLCFLRKYRVI